MQNRNLVEVHILVVTVAQEGSFVRASRKLGIDQSSLTRRIAALEKNLGAKLFYRTSRRLELTKAGQLFVMESTISLEHADRAWNLARYQAQLESGPFRIGFSPYIDTSFLPLLFRLSTPADVSSAVVLETASTREMMERVLRGQLHAALGIRPIEDEDLWVKLVGKESFSVCVPRTHRLSQKHEVTVKDLDGEMIFWVPQSMHPQFYGRVMKYIRSLGVTPVFKEVWAQAHVLEFVAQGFGLAFLPQSATRVTRTGVTFKPLADRYLGIETVLFMRRDQRHGIAKDFIDDLFTRMQAIRSGLK